LSFLKKITTGLNVFFSTAGFIFIFFLCFELIPDIWIDYRKSLKKPGEVAARDEYRAGAEDYQGKDWVPYYYFDAWSSRDKMDWHPYVYWRRAKYESPYVNVNEKGIRTTWAPENRSGKPLKIFVFGGSTLWGFGARDEFTIPSYVARLLAEKTERDIQVTNFGEAGYVLTQEVLTLLRELQRGNVPDLVIFYDGFNDAHASMSNEVSGWPLNEINRQREFNILNKRYRSKFRHEASKILFHRSLGYANRFSNKFGLVPAQSAEQDEQVLADKTKALAGIYAETAKMVSEMGEDRGFEALFFLQPTFYTKKTLSKHESTYFSQDTKDGRYLHSVYAALRNHPQLKMSPQFVDISRSLDDVKIGLYTDMVHMTERGNAEIGRVMLPNVLASLKGKL